MSNIPDCSNCLLRWSIGQQDTTRLDDFNQKQDFLDFIWLAKLSILSFQIHFPNAKYVLLYNGHSFDNFVEQFNSIDPQLIAPIEYIDQFSLLSSGKIENPYTYYPRGVWWKWIPFRLDINMHEIAVDTDIICLNPPLSWYEWMNIDAPILVAPERFEKVKVNTCGDFYQHPLLVGKKPVNCGVVGQQKGHNYDSRFFSITKEVQIGKTHDSLFITEQGAINLWIRSLELDGIKHQVLSFEKNTWFRDFVYFLHRGVKVETLHAVSWTKKMIKLLDKIFIRKVTDKNYSDNDFVQDLLKTSSCNKLARFTIIRQITNSLKIDFFCPTGKFFDV